MRLHLIDSNEELVTAWTKRFATFPEVNIKHANILDVAENCLVSPANSHGFMDGGIDAAYCAFFGQQIERTMQDAIKQRPEGHLPIGASLVVRTSHTRVPFLIVAPTMVMPEAVESRNCYRAMRAVLRIGGTNPEVGRDIYCPGLATGVGAVPPEDAAVMMAEAYRDWKCSVENKL
ncbi:MAG TPA: macro domain-containing protein [Verrucomicrobiae bacterium]|nr:macro domain-containing protein [Verrucomicrobiae bacterium]